MAALLTACGGGDEATSGTTLTLEVPDGAVVTNACSAERLEVSLQSHDAIVDGSPRRMVVMVTCGSGVIRRGGVPVDWQIVEGGGKIDGRATVRSTTDTNGVTEALWTFGTDGPVQTLEARLSPTQHASLTHTLLPRRADPCREPAVTDLGAARVVTGVEVWTRSGSPYATRCASGATCSEAITVAPGARLEMEAGVAVCARRLVVDGQARLVATGSAEEPVHLRLRTGIVLQAAPHGVPGIPSQLRHVYAESNDGIGAAGHPVVIEDSILRRVPAGEADAECPTVALRQHALSGVTPSRVQRTVIDGFGMLPNPWDYGPVCAGLQIEIGDTTPPLQASARILNSLGEGLYFLVAAGARDVAQTQLSQCEVSGSAGIGVFATVPPGADAAPRVTGCNVLGNALAGVVGPGIGATTVDARANWWGDAEGPAGTRGDGVGAGVDATQPLIAPLELGY
jgi:hypothetical protein